jgi:hypothetical protein
MHGIKTIVASMQPYKDQSCFVDLIEEQAIIPERMQPLPPHTTEPSKPAIDDVEALTRLLLVLKDVRQYVLGSGNQDEADLVDTIVAFVNMLQSKILMTSTEEQFQASRMIRTAIVAVPAKFLRRVRKVPTTMIAAAYFFATTLVVQPLFPAMGAMVCYSNSFIYFMLMFLVLRSNSPSTNQ